MTYSQATSVRARSAFGRNQNTTSFSSSRPAVGPVSNVIILVIIVALLGLVYLTQVTKTYGLGYKLSDLTSRSKQLNDEYDGLQLESAKLKTIDRVEKSTVASAMTTVAPSGYAR